jgi:hypothetical protein
MPQLMRRDRLAKARNGRKVAEDITERTVVNSPSVIVGSEPIVLLVLAANCQPLVVLLSSIPSGLTCGWNRRTLTTITLREGAK